MRAVRIVGPRETCVEDVPVPTPGPDQVRVRVEGCGVCASNLGPWLGLPWLQYPLAPGEGGHEAWGRVDALGAHVTNVREGERVALLSQRAYAEYDVVDAQQTVGLPDALDGMAFPGEAVACAMNIFRRSQIKPDETVGIVGVGFLGGILTRLASQAGARVIAISRRATALQLAKQMGASECVTMDDHARIIEQVGALTQGNLCDRVVEAVGAQWPLDLSAELTKTRGTLVVAGYHQDGPRQVNMQLWNWRGLDVVNAHERDPAVYLRGLREGVDAVASGRLDLGPLLTHRYPLAQLDEALNACASRPEGFVKAVVLA